MPRSIPVGTLSESVRLRDGSIVCIRPAQAHDEAAIRRLLEHLSPASRRLRLLSEGCDLRANARWAAHPDGTDHFGLVAVTADQRLLAHAAYARTYGPRAEVAVEVAGDLHNLGLATLLIARLARRAESHRIDRFSAEVLTDNYEMLAAVQHGFERTRPAPTHNVAHVEFSTSNWRLAAGRFDAAEVDTAAAGPAVAAA